MFSSWQFPVGPHVPYAVVETSIELRLFQDVCQVHFHPGVLNELLVLGGQNSLFNPGFVIFLLPNVPISPAAAFCFLWQQAVKDVKDVSTTRATRFKNLKILESLRLRPWRRGRQLWFIKKIVAPRNGRICLIDKPPDEHFHQRKVLHKTHLMPNFLKIISSPCSWN